MNTPKKLALIILINCFISIVPTYTMNTEAVSHIALEAVMAQESLSEISESGESALLKPSLERAKRSLGNATEDDQKYMADEQAPIQANQQPNEQAHEQAHRQTLEQTDQQLDPQQLLWHAIYHKDICAANAALYRGAQPHTPNSSGISPAQSALYLGRLNIIKAMISANEENALPMISLVQAAQKSSSEQEHPLDLNQIILDCQQTISEAQSKKQKTRDLLHILQTLQETKTIENTCLPITNISTLVLDYTLSHASEPEYQLLNTIAEKEWLTFKKNTCRRLASTFSANTEVTIKSSLTDDDEKYETKNSSESECGESPRAHFSDGNDHDSNGDGDNKSDDVDNSDTDSILSDEEIMAIQAGMQNSMNTFAAATPFALTACNFLLPLSSSLLDTTPRSEVNTPLCLTPHTALIPKDTFNQDIELFTAVRQHNIDRVHKALQKGALIDALDEMDNTPLAYAINENLVEITKTLLAHGATVTSEDPLGYTPLEQALYNNMPEIATMCVYAGAPIGIARIEKKLLLNSKNIETLQDSMINAHTKKQQAQYNLATLSTLLTDNSVLLPYLPEPTIIQLVADYAVPYARNLEYLSLKKHIIHLELHPLLSEPNSARLIAQYATFQHSQDLFNIFMLQAWRTIIKNIK